MHSLRGNSSASRQCSGAWLNWCLEHPFGTIKFWMGATHFLTKTLARVRTEMSLHVLAYNLKRVVQILGISEMLRVLAT